MRRWVESFCNNVYLFFNGDNKVKAGLHEAKTLVAEHKLDLAMQKLQALAREYRSDILFGQIGAYMDELYDTIPPRVRELMQQNRSEEVRAIVDGGKEFFKAINAADIELYVRSLSQSQSQVSRS